MGAWSLVDVVAQAANKLAAVSAQRKKRGAVWVFMPADLLVEGAVGKARRLCPLLLCASGKAICGGPGG